MFAGAFAGPPFLAKAIQTLGQQVGLEMLYIEPGSPWENGFAESFFSRLKLQAFFVGTVEGPGPWPFLQTPLAQLMLVAFEVMLAI